MKKTLFAIVLLIPAFSYAGEKISMEKFRAAGFAIPRVEIPVPAAPAPVAVPKDEVSQDLVFRFQQVKNTLWRMNSDTTWLRSDLDRLESDARRIGQGSSSPFFESDLRRKAMDMSRYANDARALAREVKNLLNLAQKDAKLNQLCRDMEWDARDLDNRFQFDIQNAAQRLEWTVRGIDPKLIGYGSQWQASDLSRYARDTQWQTRDLRWDMQELVRKTQP